MADQEPAQPRSPRQRLTRGWPLVVEIATVIGAIAAVLTWVVPRSGDDGPAVLPAVHSTVAASASGSPTAPATGGLASTADPAAAGLPLTELTPSEGGSYLSRTGTGATLVIRCPSGIAGDTSRTVVYDLRGQYRRFTAQVRVSGSPRPPVRSALEVLADDIRTGLVSINGDGAKPLAADLTVPDPRGADPRLAGQLSLRITCQLVGPTITLINPRIEP
jgi:hypothetical protein